MNAFKNGLLLILSTFVVFGCSKRADKNIESAAILDADTAIVDLSQTNPEILPTIESDTPSAVEDAMLTANSLPSTETGATDLTPKTETTGLSQDTKTMADLDKPAPESNIETLDTLESKTASGTYTVQKGDTLMGIGFKLYGSVMKWKTIYEMNKESLKNPNFLVTGAKLKYDESAANAEIAKNGEGYLIQKGDTLGTIAEQLFGSKSKWKTLWKNNAALIKNPNKIYAGFYLYYQITEEEKGRGKVTSHRTKKTNAFPKSDDTIEQSPDLPNPDETAADTAKTSMLNPASTQGKYSALQRLISRPVSALEKPMRLPATKK